MPSLSQGERHREAQARDIPEVFRMREQKAKMSKKEGAWQRGIVDHPFSESQWNRGFSV